METEKNGGPNKLQAWREFREMSREELAARLDPPTTGAVIWHLENGERALSAKWLRRLAPALDTKPGHLLDHDPNEVPADVLDLWYSIPKEQQPRAAQVLEAFRETDERKRA